MQMNGFEKLQRLVAYFASCNWDANDNLISITALENGWDLRIEFSYYNTTLLEVDFKEEVDLCMGEGWDYRLQFYGDTLHGFTDNFEGLDELLELVFERIIKTDITTISLATEVNSQ